MKNTHSESFKSKKASSETDVERLDSVLDDLDELGGIMDEMLETQENVEVYDVWSFCPLLLNH